MPFVSEIKETFALAPISERQQVVDKLAAPNTFDSYYYQGLVILEKIHAEVNKFENPLQPRPPTQAERELSDQLKEICAKIKAKYSYTYVEHLESRFNILAYPFQTTESVEYIKEKLSISSQQQSITREDQENLSETNTSNKYPSVLDPALIDGSKLIHKSLLDERIDLEAMAYPQVSAMWERLNKETQLKLINMSKNTHSIQLFGSDLMSKLAKFWDSREKAENSLPNMSYFTLDQMDEFLKLVPDIVYVDTKFVKGYLEKLVPNDMSGIQSIIWDDHGGSLKEYLDRAESFADKLPPVYRKLKSAIKFYKLRIDVTRQDFDENRLISYLSSCVTGSVTSPIPSLFNRSHKDAEKSVVLPLFGDYINENDRNTIIEEYLFGLITRDKLTVTIESLGAYLDYHKFLKPLVAKIKLTTCTPIQDSWIKDYGESAYESLVKDSFVSFANTSLNASVKRKPSDTVSLFVKTKNILRLSIRVFQIDTENYWRMHKDEQTTEINLDGFRPTFEKDFDFSSEPAIRVKYNEFKFGQGGLAAEVFNGRGLWVVEFVGGENQCRAIVQKGYLRHIIQNTFAGHVLRVLDEEGRVVEKAKVIHNKQVFPTDDSGNILIPYQQDRGSTKNVILASSIDNYCEPASFYHMSETYKLEASFYVNPEMVSFNKTATVVVVPKLTLNDMPAPLSLLDDKMMLGVVTNSINNIKNVNVCHQSSSSGDAIRFEFMVPDQLDTIDFTLKARVKSTAHKSVDVAANRRLSYGSLYSESGITTSFHLKKMSNNRYYIHVFGQNGEYKKNYELTVSLAHVYLKTPIDVQLQTNDHGFIDLGELQDIKSVKATDNQQGNKSWVLTDDYHANLPSTICVEENAQFKLTCNTTFLDSMYSLYSLVNDQLLKNVTASFLERKDGYVSIRGLPAGKYKLNFPTLQNGMKSITCIVIKPQLKVSERGIWSDWLIGENNYAKRNGNFLHKPLVISETSITDENIQVKLNNWSSKTFAIVTTSTFVPNASESLYSNIVQKQKLSNSRLRQSRVDSTRSLFLNDKRISEEYQYILNRAKAEKWTGSTLTKPSLLVYPKKHADTSANKRYFEGETSRGRAQGSRYIPPQRSAMYSRTVDSASSRSKDIPTNLAFLDHSSPLVVIPVSTENGSIVIDRKHLGHGGNLFQVVIISGEQTVFYQQLLNDNDSLKFNDLRQSNNSNKTLIRSKAVSKVLPRENIVLHTHEYETIDSFEKLFDTIVKISDSGVYVNQNFWFLKTWPSLTLEKKLETHQEHICHDLNLWLKKKDPQFFNTYVKPAIKAKLQKTFIDLYLIDGDLSEYRENFYLNNQLSVAEKALLASTGPKEHLQDALNSFIDSFENDKQAQRSDFMFDLILSESTLAAARAAIQAQAMASATYEAANQPLYEESDEDMGYGLFDEDDIVLTSEVVSGVAAGATAGIALVTGEAEGTHDDDDYEDEEDDDDDEEEFVLEQEIDLREQAKQMNKKVVYEYTGATYEWAEVGYYNLHEVSLQQFWIDYLQHFANGGDDVFLSENFIYSLNNVQEILLVLCLMDLPFSTDVDWKLESNSNNKVEFSINTNNHPLLVFYRTLAEYDGSLSTTNSHNLMLGQEIFVVDKAAPINSDECIKVDPSRTPLEPLVEYGNHLIVINISAKAVTCQITVQIPTGAVPTQKCSYYQSKTISIQPYSTWHQVVNTFYFPSSGEFAIVPVTVSTTTGDQLLAKIDAIPVHITSHADEEKVTDSNTITSQSWSKVAAKGTSESVITYLQSYRKLKKLDMKLITWRMNDKQFAQQVFDTLIKRRHYVERLWEYGVIHQMQDIIADLLQYNSYILLQRAGSGFKSPLVPNAVLDINIYDYYPLFNARAHQMRNNPEILNTQFYYQYDRFLDHLAFQVDAPSDTDLVMLTTYLLVQDRIGEANKTFSRIKNIENNEDCQLHIDYLGAYLKTRIPVTKDSTVSQQLDLDSIKETAKKYKDFGVLRWRQLFTHLYDFACEVEQGEFTVSNSSVDSKRVRSEPILEFEIDEQEQQLVVKYANIQSVEIKYYDMDIEVMFSNNPFMDSSKSASNKNISWIKPSSSETIALPEKMQVDQQEDEDFDMIGVGQLNAIQFHRIPFTAGNKNVFIQVSSGNITRQHAYYANSLSVHLAESFGVICVMSKVTKRPLAGVYIKVYCRSKGNKEVNFWKDGYTGLNGVFDYISVTQGNALTHNASLQRLMSDEIEKLSILVLSDEEGAIVKEVNPPEEN